MIDLSLSTDFFISNMEVFHMKAIFERRSIRKYTDQKIPKETILRPASGRNGGTLGRERAALAIYCD